MESNKKDFWQQRWLNGKTGWDVGYAAPPIAEYIDTLKDKNIKILIPGAGNAYEAEYLYNKGFTNVYVMDIASKPLENFKERVKDFPSDHLLLEDFFKHTGEYDLIIEQAFFIAIDPKLRGEYVEENERTLKTWRTFDGIY